MQALHQTVDGCAAELHSVPVGHVLRSLALLVQVGAK